MALKLNLNIDKLKEDIEKSEKKASKFTADERFWKTGKAPAEGSTLYQIRFLPDAEGECFVKYFTHNFKYKTGDQERFWARKCINTFGFDQKCPICEKNMEYWNSSFEMDKKIASTRKRTMKFVSNILVLKDPNNPENEGKVFLYEYGQKIYEKVVKHLMPKAEDLEDEDFVQFNPFHPVEGATFKLKVKKQGEFPNYDDSEFSVCKPLFDGNEKKMQKALDETFALSEFVALDKFPTNDEVVKYLGTLLGLTTPQNKEKNEKQKPQDDDDVPFVLDDLPSTSSSSDNDTTNDDDDPDLAYFKDL